MDLKKSLIKDLNEYYKTSGLKINQKKNQILWIGSKKN